MLAYLKKQWLVTAAFAQAVVATLGSLYFSEVVGLNPCRLCWFQRILMYPLVVIFMVGIRRKEKAVDEYVLPLAVIGWLVALYHNIKIYVANYVTTSSALTPCGGGVSCTKIHPVLFGVITIPHLSLAAFTIICVLMLIYRNKRLSR